MLEMIAGAMQALTVGDPRDLSTDVGPVIDDGAKGALDEHLDELEARTPSCIGRSTSEGRCKHGTFVTPAMYEIKFAQRTESREFRADPARRPLESGELDKVIEAINATGYGLTLGLQSRIDTVRDYVEAQRPGRQLLRQPQPDRRGGRKPAVRRRGLSGTGPKAGGPHYVARFATERVTCIDTTAGRPPLCGPPVER